MDLIKKFNCLGACGSSQKRAHTRYPRYEGLKVTPPTTDNREFTKPLGRRRGQRRQKMNLSFIFESHDTLKSLTLFITVKTITKLNPEHSDKFEK